MRYPPGNWLPVAADASARKYFRGRHGERDALLADFGGDEDGLARFVHVRGLFAAQGLKVPEILHVPEGGGCLVEEWVPGRNLSHLRWSRDFEAALLEAAQSVSAITEWGAGPDLLELDEARLSFELAFFRLHCLEGFLNAEVPSPVREGLEALAAEVAAYPMTLAHRDLHSDNVLRRKDGSLYLLDFQDALLAPRCYDAASLAVDAYRDQDPEIRERFVSAWGEKTGAPRLEFERTALQRALKALGTFGYQVTRRKRVRYMRCIAPEARHALAFLRSAPADLEELRPALRELTHV